MPFFNHQYESMLVVIEHNNYVMIVLVMFLCVNRTSMNLEAFGVFKVV